MFTLNTETMIFLVLGLLLVLALSLIRLELRIRKLTRGSSGSLEETLVELRRDVKELLQFRDDSIEYLKLIEKRLKRSIQSIETIRFNPFKGTGSGGNQSFSTSLLNEKGDGVVLSSLYSRDQVSVFSKPIKKFASDYELSDEERGVVAQAKETLSGQSPHSS
ncbi:DUF4446 family protein [Patescibacteria group bacterium]|nr:MAG: DUF4446 family protein [Patescibacteria group bacterium]